MTHQTTAVTQDYQCSTCGKVLVHINPDAPVEHVAADDHRLLGEHLETIIINGNHVWA
jgi:hypothetical protein